MLEILTTPTLTDTLGLPSDAVGSQFLDTLDDEFLTQHVTFATRFRDGQIPSTLDLIIMRDDVQLHNLTVDAPLGRSDHVMICFDFVCIAWTFLVHLIGIIYLKMVITTGLT